MRPVLFALGSLAACSYVDPDPHWADREAQLVAAEAFAPATRELRGIDPPEPADRVAKGDRILYGIAFEKAGAQRHWLVDVEVEDPEFEPRTIRDGSTRYMMRLSVRVCDEAGVEVGRDVVTVSREDLVFGLFAACRGEELPEVAGRRSLGPRLPEPAASGDEPPEPPQSAGDALFAGPLPAKVVAVLSLLNMLQVVRDSEVLFDILWTVIDKPSIFSVIGNLGVTVSLQDHFDKAEKRAPVAIDGREYPVYELPIELRLNGVPGLRSKLLVTEPMSPLNLSAGILGMDAFQPSDPSARVSIRVLAARRVRDGSN